MNYFEPLAINEDLKKEKLRSPVLTNYVFVNSKFIEKNVFLELRIAIHRQNKTKILVLLLKK